MSNLQIPSDFIQVGYIGGLFGFEGLLRISVEPRFMVDDALPKPFLYFIENGMYVPRFISKWDADQSLVGFERFPNREDAHKLTDQNVFLRKQDLPVLTSREGDSGNWDPELLKGFEIRDIDQPEIKIGIIERISEFPGGWMAETQLEIRSEMVLIPLATPLIHRIDRDDEIVFMDLPEGLLEL